MKTAYCIDAKSTINGLGRDRIAVTLDGEMFKLVWKLLCDHSYQLRQTIESETASVEERTNALNEYLAKERIMEQLRNFD